MFCRSIRVFVFCTLVSLASFSQVRNLVGMQALGVSVGLTGHGFYIGQVYERILLPKFSFKGELLSEISSMKGIGFNTFSLYANVNYNVYNLGERLFFKAGGGMIGQMGIIHDVESFNKDLESIGFNYGFMIEPEVDIFVWQNLVLNLSYKQGYLVGNYLGNFVFFTSMGLKYQF